jgi:hypothetical protein
VKAKNTNFLMQNKNILLLALIVVLLLMIPLVAMQFTHAVAWSPLDFATAGALLFGAGLAFELIARKASGIAYKAALAAALATALFLVWANLAVGILGSEDNPANWMYVGVLAVGIAGAIIARFQPRGMARALFATGLAQVLVTGVALITQKDLSGFEIVMVNGFFVVLWIGSALLFLRAKFSVRPQ